MSKRSLAFFSLLTLPFFSLHADLIGFPDDLISGTGETKLELGINYNNGTLYNCSSLFGGCYRTNYDALTWSPGIRYGLNSKTEIYAHSSWLNIRSKNTELKIIADSPDNTVNTNNDRLQDLWFGVNHRIWDDALTPGLLVFLEGAAMENVSLTSNTDWVHGKTWVAGATLYRSIDPIILSATASYRYSASRDIQANNGETLNPGDSFLFNPSISFAANNEVSITSGFQWQYQKGDIAKGLSNHSSTRTDLTLGMGYMWSNDLTFHVSTSTDMTGDGGSSISLLALYTLGKEIKQSASTLSSASSPKDLNAPPVPKTPIIATPITPIPVVSSPKTVMTQTIGGKTLWLECTKISSGWDKEILKCENIDENKTLSSIPLKTISDELSLGKQWITTQNPNHYTVEISIHSLADASLLLDHLAKTRFSYPQPSHLHSLTQKRAAVALGSFGTRSDALNFLNMLPFVTNKNNSFLRTFGGLTKEINSLK
jgi:hypothetical protein